MQSQSHCKTKSSPAASKLRKMPRRWDQEKAADAVEKRGFLARAFAYRHCMHYGITGDGRIEIDLRGEVNFCHHKFYKPLPCRGYACLSCYGYQRGKDAEELRYQLKTVVPATKWECLAMGKQFTVVVLECIRELDTEPVTTDTKTMINDLAKWQKAIKKRLKLREQSHAMERLTDVERDPASGRWRVVGRVLYVGPRLPRDAETLWRGEDLLSPRQMRDVNSAVDALYAPRADWADEDAGVIEAALRVRSTQPSGALLGAPKLPKKIVRCPVHGNEIAWTEAGGLVETLRADGRREVWEVAAEARQARAGPADAAAA